MFEKENRMRISIVILSILAATVVSIGRGYHTACVPIGGKVLVSGIGGDSYLYAFNPDNGNIEWQYGLKGGDVVPCRWVHQGKEYAVFIAGDNSDSVICIDPADGSPVWKRRFAGLMKPIRDFTISGDHMVLTENFDLETNVDNSDSIYNVCYTLSLTGPVEKWRHHSEVRYNKGGIWPIAHGNFYSGNRTKESDGTQWRMIYSVDMETGQRNGEIYGISPARAGFMQVVEDKLFIQPDGRHGSTTQIYNVGPLPRSFDTLTNWIADHPSTSSYAEGPIYHPIVDGRMYMRGSDGIYCYDLRKNPLSATAHGFESSVAPSDARYGAALSGTVLNLHSASTRTSRVRVYTPAGRMLVSRSFLGKHSLALPNRIAKGVHVVVISDSEGISYRGRFIHK